MDEERGAELRTPAVRFGVFEVDPVAGELRKQGRRIKLQEQPLQILLMLLARPGELVTRDELRQQLWAADTFVDFDHGVNAAVKRLRDALGDSAENPRFIETLPRRGYRFVAPVEAPTAERASGRRTRTFLVVASMVAILLATTIGLALRYWRRPPPAPTDRVLRKLTSNAGLTSDPAVSPDGKLLAYASDRSGEGNLDIWVQQLGGGGAVRLTRSESEEREPSFSPDGTRIAYRSSRDGGGIYVVAALGGEERLLAREGRRPRFSPDGKRILFWTGAGDTATTGTSRMLLVSPDGGEARPIRPDFAAALQPVWSPDGERILFLGARQATGGVDNTSEDWWVARPDGGPPVKTGVAAVLKARGLSTSTQPWNWAPGNRILFSTQSGDSFNVWQVTLSPTSWQVVGAPERVTSGTGIEVQPSFGPDGAVVFSSRVRDVDLWSLALGPNGRSTGTVQRIAETASDDINPYLAADGRTLAHVSLSGGSDEIWLVSLDTGQRRSVTKTPAQEAWPIVSFDGSRVVYAVADDPNRTVVYVTDRAGASQKICDDCGRIRDWSADGAALLFQHGQPRRIALLDVASGRKTDILAHPTQNLYQSYFSRDGGWITFLAQLGPERRRLVAARFRGVPVPASDWVQISDGTYSDDKPRLSPDGARLYFTSNRDGFVCFWGQQLDPATKRPLGDPFPVQHFHKARLSIMSLPLPWGDVGISTDRLVFPLAETTGNIWMSVPEHRD